MEQPTITRITETNKVSNQGTVSKVIIITYNVGILGPFTLEATSQELQDGTATARINEFASALGRLPLAPGV